MNNLIVHKVGLISEIWRYAQLQNDWATDTDVKDGRDLG